MSVTTNTVIDLAWLESASLADLKAVLAMARVDASKLNAVNALLNTPEGQAISHEMLDDPNYVPKSQRQPSAEEAAQIAADLAVAEQQAAEAEVVRLANEKAVADAAVAPVLEQVTAQARTAAATEDAEALKHGIAIHRDANGSIIKLVKSYQVVDETTGRPIGRPTHLEAKSWIELATKDTAAHENAVRYAERVKKNLRSSSQAAAEVSQAEARFQQAEKEANEATQLVATEKDPIKVADAIRKVNVADRNREIAAKAAAEHGRIIAETWMADHTEDFLPCVANTTLIGQWLQANKLEATYENLERAFMATETRLAKPPAAVPVEAVPATVAPNPPAVVPVAPVTPVAPIVPPVAPVATAPVSTVAPTPTPVAATTPAPTSAVAPIAQPAARRPAVNGSLPPGSMSAARPIEVPQTPEATRDQLLLAIKKMTPSEYRNKLQTKQFRDQLEAAGIQVAGKAQYTRG